MSPLRKSIPVSTFHTYNPFNAIQRTINRAMDDFYNWFERPTSFTENWEDLTLTPSVDIVEDKGNFKVEAEMPGIGPDDVKVSVTNGLLTIKGEKKTSRKDQGKNYMMREIGYGCYQRSLSLPEAADIDQAKASFKKGMLWVTLPKKPEFKKSGRELKIEKMKE